MKRLLFIFTAVVFCFALNAADLTGKRIYVNPGHGSFGPNDRPMATIPYPALASTGMPDTCGFYESNTNLWKCLYLGERLKQAGASVMYSRTKNGPWPYQKVNGEYPDYSWDNYQNLPNYTQYNKNLSEICEEVEANNIDLFISVHSNAATEGSTTNYPVWLFRGEDTRTTTFEQECYAVGKAIWPYRWEMFAAGFDHSSYYSATNMCLRGDITFYGSSSTRTSAYSGKSYKGYLGVLKHGAIGGLEEGYFHTYQPARHRALNHDYCKMEGYSYYRGIIDYFNADKDTKGYIIGTVKDMHEKMVHKLYNYAPKTNDQWVPCNGAIVTLYKGGKKIADYTVDSLYNGIFYFGNLEPGNDYSLDASCEGYNNLYQEYKQPLEVKANIITFPFIFLESDSYEPPKEVYYTYPDPVQDAWLGMPGKFVLSEPVTQALDVLADKTIRRSILRNDTTMFVLALDDSKNPYLYLINPSTMIVKATLPTDFCTVSSEGNLKLSDIAVTAEGVLIGCNEEKVTYTPSNKWLVYKWTQTEDGSWSGAVWLDNTNNETAGNYLNAVAGSTLAYAGSLEEGVLYSSAYTVGSDAHAVRYFLYTISDGAYVGALRNQDGNHKLSEMGHNIKFTVSPLGDNKVIITDDNIAPMEWEVVNATSSAPVITNTNIGGLNGISGISCFKYAKHSLMALPAVSDGKNTGVKLYDITNGFDKSQLVITVNTEIEAAAATYMFAAGTVKNADLTLWLEKDTTVSRFTTIGVDQPVIPNVNAYDLKMTYDAGAQEYYVTFEANADAAASIVFYQKGKEVGELNIGNIHKGHNGTSFNASNIKGFSGTPTNWAIRLEGDNVANWKQLHFDNSMLLSSTTRIFSNVDNSPESDYFGRIYIMRRAGSSASADRPKNGIYAFNQDYTPINNEVLKGGCEFGNPGRLTIDSEGYIYQADWADGYSGVYVINPSELEGSFTQFFQGSRNSAGLFTNNGVPVGSSTPGVNIYGNGADTKLIVYNEDAGGTLPANGLAIYNIGQPDGTILRTWGEAPSAVIPLSKQGNTEGTPLGTSHGVFVSQVRSAGNNNSAAASLMFYDYSGKCLLSSDLDPYKDIIDGSNGGGYALSQDESVLVLNGGSSQFYVFDVVWKGDTPVLNLRYEYKHGIASIRQMNFDYGGNLICSGETGWYVFTMPTDNNVTTIPAKKNLTMEKPFSGHVEGVLLDSDELTLTKGETTTLSATVMPEQATEKNVTWSSSNDAVATVADGVVTAVKSGEAVITVTTTEGNFKAECKITVITPVTGVSLNRESAEVIIGESLTLVATVAPDDADNKAVTWVSADTKVATVNNGVVTAVGVGSTTITVKTIDGEFTAACILTVKPIAVTGVEISEASLTLTVGDTHTLTATVKPDDATDKSVTWSSSAPAVATVVDGVVTAVAAGEAVITAKTVDGEFTATCAVKVEKAPVPVTGVSLDKSVLELSVGGIAALEAIVAPADADNKAVVWSSSNDAVVTVADGLVTAVAEGNAVITVRTEDGGFTAECNVKVTVVDGLEELSVNGIYYRNNVIYNDNALSLHVYDTNGRLVASGNGNIDMSSMQSGVYIVRNGNLGMKIMR